MIDRSPRTPELQRSPPTQIQGIGDGGQPPPRRRRRVALFAGGSADRRRSGRRGQRGPRTRENSERESLTRVSNADLSMPPVWRYPVAPSARPAPRRPHDRSFAANARAPAFAPNPNTRNRRRRPTAAQAAPAGRSVCGWLCRPTSLRSARPARPSHTREFGARKPNAAHFRAPTRCESSQSLPRRTAWARSLSLRTGRLSRVSLRRNDS